MTIGGVSPPLMMFPSVSVAMVPTWVWKPEFSTFHDRDIIYAQIDNYLREGRRVGVSIEVIFQRELFTECSCCCRDLVHSVRLIMEEVGGYVSKVTVEVTPAPPEAFYN